MARGHVRWVRRHKRAEIVSATGLLGEGDGDEGPMVTLKDTFGSLADRAPMTGGQAPRRSAFRGATPFGRLRQTGLAP